MNVAILFTSFGPYHIARIQALHKRLQAESVNLIGVRFGVNSAIYHWETPPIKDVSIITLTQSNNSEACLYSSLICNWLDLILRLKIRVAFLPSYYPMRNLICLLIARTLGVRCIMMNESWDQTSSSSMPRRIAKKTVLNLFDAGLVGGNVHRRHFISLGMRSETLFCGYDVVDNSFFEHSSQHAQKNADDIRSLLCLPQRYFLSLGRMVEKKNLAILIKAYASLIRRSPQTAEHLVFVGSGEKEDELKRLCKNFDLPIVEHKSSQQSHEQRPFAVHFFGFRQIDENPLFYSLATAFILPSSYEEWGLVVNEAMACGLPIIASKYAGCAEDLVHHGQNGFVFDPNDFEELAYYLDHIAKNPVQSRKMGAFSRSRISQWSCTTFAENAWKAIQAALS